MCLVSICICSLYVHMCCQHLDTLHVSKHTYQQVGWAFNGTAFVPVNPRKGTGPPVLYRAGRDWWKTRMTARVETNTPHLGL